MWLLGYTAAFSMFVGLLRAKYHDRITPWMTWLCWVALLGAGWLHVIRHNLGPVGIVSFQQSFLGGAFASTTLELPPKPVLLEGETEESEVHKSWTYQRKLGSHIGVFATVAVGLLSLTSIVWVGLAKYLEPEKPEIPTSPVPFDPANYLVYVWPKRANQASGGLAYYVALGTGDIYVARDMNGNTVGFQAQRSKVYHSEMALKRAGYVLAQAADPMLATSYTTSPVETPSSRKDRLTYPRTYEWASSRASKPPGAYRYVVPHCGAAPTLSPNASDIHQGLFPSEQALLAAGYVLVD